MDLQIVRKYLNDNKKIVKRSETGKKAKEKNNNKTIRKTKVNQSIYGNNADDMHWLEWLK